MNTRRKRLKLSSPAEVRRALARVANLVLNDEQQRKIDELERAVMELERK